MSFWTAPYTPSPLLFKAFGSSNQINSSSKLAEPRAFDNIKEIYQRNFELHEKDGVIKIAILDTGFGPMSDDQNFMIKSRKNFCDHRAEDDVVDLDGHGTAVAGIILRLAPRSEVYIARICAGVPDSGEPEHPQPATVAEVCLFFL